jgi:hypothetical protein
MVPAPAAPAATGAGNTPPGRVLNGGRKRRTRRNKRAMKQTRRRKHGRI